jgi:hypothetical protein
MPVFGIGYHGVGVGKHIFRDTLFGMLHVWIGIKRIITKANGIWPKVSVDGFGPTGMGMNEHSPCHIL